MAGVLSPDRLFFWDGRQWNSTTSPDGAWRWDGMAWRPASGRVRGSHRMTWLVGGLAVASLLVGSFGVYLMSSVAASRLQGVFQSAGLTPACTSPQAKPGSPASTGDTVCGVLLGAPSLVADCTTGSVPPVVDVYDSVGDSSDSQTVQIAASEAGCGMNAAPDHIRNFESADVLGASAVVIADFVPMESAGGIGVQVACTEDAGCVDFAIYADGTFSLDEGVPGDGFRTLTSGRTGAFGPIVDVGSDNRMIVQVLGRHVTVFVNGYRVTRADTQGDPSAGYVTFYVDDRGSSTYETVQLQRLLAYAAL